MLCDDDNSPPYVFGPYNSSLASSASSSSSSVIWSDNASQASDDSQSSVSDSECYQAWDEHRNPRRTGLRTCPPPLVRQSERKVLFVDSLVDSSAQIVEAIWPLSSVACRNEMGAKGVLPLRTFIQETLRRSRTSYSTLQVALYYLILVKPHVPKHDFTMEQPDDAQASRALQCGRRMFLSALILASKYLQDRNYSARAWSKISGLRTEEINQNEMAFLLAVNWNLHITEVVFQRWTDIVLKYTPTPGRSEPCSWKSIILILNPQLDNIKSDYLPNVMEPCPSAYPSKPAPALGLLPTPRGFNTPAASLASNRSMCFAMSQAPTSCEKWLTPSTFLGRRSSLANSVMSSPESMISDTSRSSRSSSISSASSLSGAPHPKLDVLARCRYAKQCSESRMTVPGYSSSPEMELADYSANDAARALQDLHNHPRDTGTKRRRPISTDLSIQDTVRGLLDENKPWDVRSHRKRVCCPEPQRPGMWAGILN